MLEHSSNKLHKIDTRLKRIRLNLILLFNHVIPLYTKDVVRLTLPHCCSHNVHTMTLKASRHVSVTHLNWRFASFSNSLTVCPQLVLIIFVND